MVLFTEKCVDRIYDVERGISGRKDEEIACYNGKKLYSVDFLVYLLLVYYVWDAFNVTVIMIICLFDYTFALSFILIADT